MDLLATASAAAGTTLTEPVDLGGSDRTTVLRCRTPDATTVVVKAHHGRSPYFAAEAAGLTFTDHGPRPLAVDPAHQLIVMTDLGTGPSLADALLGTSAATATAALLAWATTYGRIAAETIGGQTEFTALRARYSQAEQPPADGFTDGFTDAIAALDVPAPGTVTRPGGPQVFSPGDICPDNNVFTGDTLHVLDFEGAGYHSVFLDAAYATMPFATCWCVFRLPDELTDRIEAAYRTEVVTVLPELADDDVWRTGVRQAIGWWTADITAALAARATRADLPMHDTRRPVPTARQLLRHRWQHALDNVTGPLADTFAHLLKTTEHWDVDPLPLYPAFTGGRTAPRT